MKFDKSLERMQIMKQLFCNDLVGRIAEFDDDKKRWAKGLYKDVLLELQQEANILTDTEDYFLDLRNEIKEKITACHLCGDCKGRKMSLGDGNIRCWRQCRWKPTRCVYCCHTYKTFNSWEHHCKTKKHKKKVLKLDGTDEKANANELLLWLYYLGF